MTDEMTSPNSDPFATEVAELLAAGPTPDHRSGFWAQIDAELTATPTPLLLADRTGESSRGAVASSSTVVPLTPAVERADDERRYGVRWLIAAAAAFLAILGFGGYLLAGIANDESTVYAGDGDGGSDDYSSRPASVEGSNGMVVVPLLGLTTERLSGNDTVLFTVESEVPLRTRAAVLDRYQDAVWGGRGAFQPVTDGKRLESEFVDMASMLSSLSWRPSARIDILDPATMQLWRPIPANPETITILGDGALMFRRENDAIIASDRREDPANRYVVTYTDERTRIGIDDSQVATTALSGDLAAALAPYLELPDDARDTLKSEVDKITTAGQTPAQIAKRLEIRFRLINVESLARPTGGLSAITLMLDINRGQIEQIAQGFATAARAAGIPSRIVVGYEPGQLADGRADLWEVRSRDKTAWVELFVEGRWQSFFPAQDQRIDDRTRPVANRDHWHAIFAIYDCRTDSYLPVLMSQRDDDGIHSHQDGLISIHPWFEESAGENATLGLFFENMGVEVTPDRIIGADDDFEVRSNDSCPDGSIVHLRKWRFDFEVASAKPEITTTNIGNVRFLNDREVYVLAVAPLDADLPPIPEELFRRLDEWTAPAPSAADKARERDGVPAIDGANCCDKAVPAPADPPAPLKEAGPGREGIYIPIRDGDTFETIAARVNIYVATLMASNPDVDQPEPGQKLWLPLDALDE